MSIFVIIIGCYTAVDWITDIVIFINNLSSLFNIAHSTAIGGQLRHHIWSSMLLLIIITVGCVCRRRLFSSSSWLVDFVIAFDACLHLHRRLAFVTTDRYPRLHGWLIMSPLMGIFIFFTSCIVCHRLIISLPWLHNFIAGRLHIHCWLTWLLPTGFFASTAMQLHHFWLVSLSSLLPIFLPPLVGNIISILVVLSLCQLRQLPSMDNCDYDRRTSYILRGLLPQTQVSYLQFGLVPDTCNMNLMIMGLFSMLKD